MATLFKSWFHGLEPATLIADVGPFAPFTPCCIEIIMGSISTQKSHCTLVLPAVIMTIAKKTSILFIFSIPVMPLIDNLSAFDGQGTSAFYVMMRKHAVSLSHFHHYPRVIDSTSDMLSPQQAKMLNVYTVIIEKDRK